LGLCRFGDILARKCKGFVKPAAIVRLFVMRHVCTHGNVSLFNMRSKAMFDNRDVGAGFLILLVFGAVLYGDGCFVWKKGADLEEPTQRAIIYWQGGREALILQVKYAGAAEDFAWIVPLPGRPEVDAIDVEKSPFEELSLYTQRRRRWGYKGRAAAEKEAVTVLERKVVGVYDVAVLAASEAGALSNWLNNNGYAFPQERKDVLEHYTRKKWVYVAMRIDRKALKSDEVKKLKTGELQPIRFRFAAKEMVYPLKISSVNSGQTEVLLYVLADAPMAVEGKHEQQGLSIERNICGFAVYQDPEFGTYRKARGEELPLTWEALGVPKDKGLSLCKYRAVYKTVEMTNDLVFERFEPIPYWRERLGEWEGKAGYRRHHAGALSVLGYHDAELLKKLAKDEDAGMRAVAAVNPRTPRELLLELARDKDASVRRDMAQNIRAPGYLLAVLAKDRDRDVKRYVVWNPNTPAEVLQTLAEDSSSQIRAAVAWSRRASVDLLGRLARDKDAKVREAVAGNSNASAGIVGALAEDRDATVRARVASRGDIAAGLLGKLASDEDVEVRKGVSYNPNTFEDALRRLAKDADDWVRCGVAHNQNTAPEVLRKLAKDGYGYVRSAVATNPNTPEDVLRMLAQDEDRHVSASAKRALEKRGNLGYEEIR
jgi:hypothetical protein